MDIVSHCFDQVVNFCQGCGCKTHPSSDESEPLGMEDGSIADSSITASSTWQNKVNAYGPQRARLNMTGSRGKTGGWCCGGNDATPWIQVDLQKETYIISVVTQGRNEFDQWVTKYQVAYSDDDKTWSNVADLNGDTMTFTGNTDRNTHVTNTFPSAVNARFLRIKPTQWKGHGSLRFEILGCRSHE